MSRLLIVSNRLPVTVRVEHGNTSVVRSSGGLVAALRDPHERLNGLWIGWPGDLSRLSAEQRQAVDAQLRELHTLPVHLTAAEVSRYYDGFSNGVLWPLFHYLLDKVRLDARREWEAYRDVNERFAAIIAAEHQPGDMVWIHDYQLALVPGMLRQRIPDARIGFFLHIPFPSAEVFRILPWRHQILRGLLGADVLGFHTASYRYHFVYSAARVLGLDPDLDRLSDEGRQVRLGVYPVSVDVEALARYARNPEVFSEAVRIRARSPGQKIVLGIDRLDYTKGIPRRLLAIERLLEREPELRHKVSFIQLAVPTREKVEAYAEFQRLVNEMVGRINGRFATVDAVPINFLHRSIPMERVVALYLVADVMLVTPLRDGMNLVAKEYVASRVDGEGTLVLSEFAGAAAELVEALQVNPYDIDSVALTMKQALTMPEQEQRVRMQALRRRVAAYDVHQWTEAFLRDLEDVRHAGLSSEVARRACAPAESIVALARAAPSLCLLLDYDGTLVPIASMPELAPPDEELLGLLRRLAARPHTQIHIVSGRARRDLERWLGDLPVHLHAEHGFWSRRAPGAPWVPLRLPSAAEETSPADAGGFGEHRSPAWVEAWKATIRPMLDELTGRTAGSFVEEKGVSLAWHYRAADPELAQERARELPSKLAPTLRAWGLELLTGSKVMEVRLRGVNKGTVVSPVLAAAPAGMVLIAFGDDQTDEDLFAALPPSSITIHVGGGASRAAFNVPDSKSVRSFLRSLVDA